MSTDLIAVSADDLIDLWTAVTALQRQLGELVELVSKAADNLQILNERVEAHSARLVHVEDRVARLPPEPNIGRMIQ